MMLTAPLAAVSAVFFWDGPPSSQAAEPLLAKAVSAAGAVKARFSANDGDRGSDRGGDRGGDRDRDRDRDGETAGAAPCRTAVRYTCVVDGDTFWYHGARMRMVDSNTPEASQTCCPAEAELGAAATRRLALLLNDGPFNRDAVEREADRYGRALRNVTRGSDSVGLTMAAESLAEGLAEVWQGKRGTWC